MYGTEQFVLLAGAGAATVVAAYLLGARQRDQRERVEEQLTALQERNRLLAIERDQRTEMAAAAERARIARELHDIVAHSLSVIVVQADGGAAAITAAPGSAAELAPRVLGTIAETSREALDRDAPDGRPCCGPAARTRRHRQRRTPDHYAPAPGTPRSARAGGAGHRGGRAGRRLENRGAGKSSARRPRNSPCTGWCRSR